MNRRALGATALVVALLLAVVTSLALGARGIDLSTVLTAVLRSDDPGLDPVDLVVVRELRVPRTVVGLLAGAGLGVSGGLMQGTTRNPIADPGLLGVTAGASFAVVLGIAALGASGPAAFAALALAGALGASALIAAIAARPRIADTPVLLVVAGSAVTAALTPSTATGSGRSAPSPPAASTRRSPSRRSSPRASPSRWCSRGRSTRSRSATTSPAGSGSAWVARAR